LAKLILSGSTSGSISLESPAVSGTTTLTLPANTGTVVVTSGAQTIEFADGSASTPSITNSGDTNTGMFFPAANTIASSTGGSERMRIDSGGNLLVGTATRASDLVTFASAGASLNQLGLRSTDDSTGNPFIVFRNSAGTAIGTVTRNGITNAVLYNTTSDYRLKENVTPLSNALDRISKLKPVQWIWKDCNNQTGEGFIAHEVQEIIPSAVNGTKDAVDAEGNPKYQGMDASYLVATLTAAIQEQQTIIETLKSDIAELKAKVNV
jgi:hypothetical protein